MDGINAAAPCKKFGHLRKAIARAIQYMDFSAWIDTVQQGFVIDDVIFYKNYFSALRGSGGSACHRSRHEVCIVLDRCRFGDLLLDRGNLSDDGLRVSHRVQGRIHRRAVEHQPGL